MKSMVLTGKRKMELVDTPLPSITNPNDVLIKMSHVGVCGSDVHYYETGRIGDAIVEYPFAVGHEGAGVVEAVGKEVRRVRPGYPVAIDPAMPCFTCDQCRAGRSHTCRNLRFLGCPGQAEGCLSEYIVMPEHSCFALSEGQTLEQGALAEPLSVGIYATRLAGDLQGKDIGILGSGPIGLSVLIAAKNSGARSATVTDRLPDRLRMATAFGADLCIDAESKELTHDVLSARPQGLHTVFECCGEQDALDQAIELLQPGGTLVIIGIPRVERISFNPSAIRQKEIRVQNVRRQNECVQPALDLISADNGSIDPMVTHRFSFEDTAKAFDLVADYADGVIKAMITL